MMGLIDDINELRVERFTAHVQTKMTASSLRKLDAFANTCGITRSHAVRYLVLEGLKLHDDNQE